MEENKDYHAYRYGDHLTPGSELKIEHSVVCENVDISTLITMGIDSLEAMRQGSIDGEQKAYEIVVAAAKQWEQQAAATQTINRALEYLRTPEIEHTGNQWKDTDNWRADQKISNRVYQMTCSIWEDTKYDRETKQSVPIAWYVTWEVRIHSPKQGYGAKIAGQNQKRYTDKNAAIKYLDGRKKAYSHLFTEISPPIPKEYEHHFMVRGTLLPGYTVEGLEQAKTEHESYKIRVFNTINFQKSMHFNPFAYIHSEKDILKIVTTLIANTKGEGKAGDDFWVKAETLLYTALIGYIYYEAPANEQNFATLVEMLNAMEVREDDESFKNAVDLLFDALEQKDPDHFALRQYKKYKLAAGKTAKSILISCASRLAPFDIKEVREITMYDELDLDMLGDERTALFLIMSDTDGTFAFLISLIYSILFNRLCERADDVYGGRLPIHVRCLIDEAANIGQIPNLERLMATIRSREISACLVLQAQSQLKALYKDNMDTIIGNCDASLFLGGKEETTLKSWNSLLGKETIDLYNTSVTKGNQESHGQNFQKLGKDLMSVDELAVMDGGKCLLQIRGVRPFLSRKYDITKHPNYKLLSDFNEKNAFNIEKFLSTRMPMRPGERYRNYEVTAEDLASQTL